MANQFLNASELKSIYDEEAKAYNTSLFGDDKQNLHNGTSQNLNIWLDKFASNDENTIKSFDRDIEDILQGISE